MKQEYYFITINQTLKRDVTNDESHYDECDNEECEKCCPDGCVKIYLCGHESDKCMAIGLKINGTNIECIDYSC